jgi:flagellar basal-body rod protein FlgG
MLQGGMMAVVRRGALACLALVLVWLVLSGAHFRASTLFPAGGLSVTNSRGPDSEGSELRGDHIPRPIELQAGTFSPLPNSSPRAVRMAPNSPARPTNTKELPELTSEDQKIWQEMLKDLPPSARRDVLEVRKRLGHLHPSQPSLLLDEPMLLEPDAQAARPAPVELLPHAAQLDEPDPQPMIEQTRAAIAKARAVTLNNISNLNSIGYKREVYSLESAAVWTAETSAVALARSSEAVPRRGAAMTVMIDPMPGRLRATGQTLDLAIDGAGFFQLTDADDSVHGTHFTRCGRLEADNEERLVLRTGNKKWLLQPSITIPSATISIEVDSTGTVQVIEATSSDSHPIGRIQTATFVDARTLVPIGACVYRVNGQQPGPHFAAPGLCGHGTIRHGFLEESNVKLQEELEKLQQLAQLEQALQQAAQTIHRDSSASGDPLIGSGPIGSDEKSGSFR